MIQISEMFLLRIYNFICKYVCIYIHINYTFICVYMYAFMYKLLKIIILSYYAMNIFLGS